MKIKILVASGDIKGHEVFLLSVKLTFESTYYQEYSTSWKLSEIILRLYQAIDGDLLLHVIYVTGTQNEGLRS